MLTRKYKFYCKDLFPITTIQQQTTTQLGGQNATPPLKSVKCNIIISNKQTNNNDLLEKHGGTKNCIYKDYISLICYRFRKYNLLVQHNTQIRSDILGGLAFLSAPLRCVCTTAVQIYSLVLLSSSFLLHTSPPASSWSSPPPPPFSPKEQHLLQWVPTPHTKSPPHSIQCFTLSDKMCQRLLSSSTNRTFHSSTHKALPQSEPQSVCSTLE